MQQEYSASSIIITHDLTCAKTTSDRVTMLTGKKFLTPGTFEEIFNDTNEVTKIFYDYNFTNDK